MFARILVTKAARRRAALVAGLVVVERLLTPAAARVLFEHGFATKVAVAFALAVVFTLRTFVQRMLASRTEAELFDRVIRSLLEGDVLRTSVLPDEDARSELGQGVYETSRQIAIDLPTLGANVFASGVLGAVILVAEPPRLVFTAIAVTVAAAGALAWSRGQVQLATSRAWELQRRVFDQLVDAMEGRLELVGLGLSASFLAESRNRTRAWGAASTRIAAATLLAGRLPLLAIAAIVAIAVSMDARWRGTFAVTAADAALLASMTPAFAGVAQGLHGMARAERWVRVVARVIGGARSSAQGGRPPPVLPASIAFDRVSFRYDGSPGPNDALHEVSFAWEKGDGILALAGANGSGKSTCLRLLLALGKPHGGALRVGGVDVLDVDADAWRSRIAFLPQRPYLPQRSDVRTAVHLLAPGASDARIERALERVGLLGALQRASSPPLDVRVDTLSAGQRQRVALARFLCRDASLLLLDEPDANLDREGIARVGEILRELARDHMIAFAAHTPELVAIAGRVVALDAGRVVSQ